MGLIKAVKGAVGGVLADQWKEYFYCEALPETVLAVKGQKRTSGRGSNRGSDNIITSGSVIAVADGQCMMIVDQGQVVELAAEPGEYTYDASTEPTVFSGDLAGGLMDTFRAMGKRFSFGGEAPKDQRVYYFNIKELVGNKYGTPSPVPFRVVDEKAFIDMDITIRCFGEYSYRICNPMLFYANVCGNVSEPYTRDRLDSQLKTELLTALQPAFAKISDMGIRYSSLPGHTMEIADALNEVLTKSWREKRGLEVVSFGISSMKADEEVEAEIRKQQMQMGKEARLTDPGRAAARLVEAQGNAMEAAAANTGAGPAMAFMGMNMAGNAGGINAQDLYNMQAQRQAAQAAQAPAPGSWKCACGNTVTGNFCPECGAKKPEPKPTADSWTCTCGAVNQGKFCAQCGAKRPEAPQGWTCTCGAVNQGNFCTQCGAKKPAPALRYRCGKCGWVPEDPAHPPKFCPECGDPFDDGDVQEG